MKSDTRDRAYKAAATITREQLRRDAPERARTLDEVEASDVVVVAGCYDHVESVLGALEVPHVLVQPEQVDRPRAAARAAAHRQLPGPGLGRGDRPHPPLRRGRREPVHHRLGAQARHRAGVPRRARLQRRPTPDDVVRIEVRDHDNIYLQGVLDGQDDPQWWLEGSSYPITVLDTERVQVLITSRELGEKYGEAPVAVWFRWGEGDVFHMISHYYLQRTELRTERHAGAAAATSPRRASR